MKFIGTDLNKFNLPYTVNYDNEYYVELEQYLRKYLNHVKDITGISKECIENTKRNIKQIFECLKLYNNANIDKAKKCIYDIMKKYIKEQLIVSTLDESYAFRAMSPPLIRPKEYSCNNNRYNHMNEYKLSFFRARTAIDKIKRKDMFHISFDKRGLISTQRFSIAGVPCLYLGTSSLVCWLEMDRPDLNIFQVSSYELPKNLKILNMCISQSFINGQTKGGCVDSKELEGIYNLIEFFPLICATSFKVLENNRDFKSEYIVSQLIMQVANELQIDGIAYLSKRMDDSYSFPQCVNLAILMPSKTLPPYENELDKYWHKSNEISLTKPFKYEAINKKYSSNKAYKLSYINEIYSSNKKIIDEIEILNEKKYYKDTLFSRFDNFLVNQEHIPFDKTLLKKRIIKRYFKKIKRCFLKCRRC